MEEVRREEEAYKQHIEELRRRKSLKLEEVKLRLYLLLRPGRGAEYCDQFVCLCVCLSVCPRAYLWNCCTDLHEIFVQIPVAVARSSSGGVAIRYALPVLWMTSRLAIVGRVAMRGRLNL